MRHLLKGYWPNNPSKIFLEEATKVWLLTLNFIFLVTGARKKTATKTLNIVEVLNPTPSNININLFSSDKIPLHYMVRTGKSQILIAGNTERMKQRNQSYRRVGKSKLYINIKYLEIRIKVENIWDVMIIFFYRYRNYSYFWQSGP